MHAPPFVASRRIPDPIMAQVQPPHAVPPKPVEPARSIPPREVFRYRERSPSPAAAAGCTCLGCRAEREGVDLKFYPPPCPTRDIDRRFDLHKPRTPADGEKLDELRAIVKRTAALVVHHTPDNRERALALTKLEEVLYFAIAAIVRPIA